MGTGDPLPWVNRLEREDDHSPQSGFEDENAWSYTSTPQYVLMVWCLMKLRMSSWL